MCEDTLRWQLLYLIARDLDVPLGTVAAWSLSTRELEMLEAETRWSGAMFRHKLGNWQLGGTL
jgi:hypothetical protein